MDVVDCSPIDRTTELDVWKDRRRSWMIWCWPRCQPAYSYAGRYCCAGRSLNCRRNTLDMAIDGFKRWETRVNMLTVCWSMIAIASSDSCLCCADRFALSMTTTPQLIHGCGQSVDKWTTQLRSCVHVIFLMFNCVIREWERCLMINEFPYDLRFI